MPAQIDFWFTMGSTYTYLTVVRLPAIEQETGIHFVWRPFDLNPILREMKHTPFKDKPTKAAYMWRDIERRAVMHGIEAKVPAPYPSKDSARANRIAIVGMREGWGRDFVCASYRRWFLHGEPNGEEPSISETLRAIGQDPDRVLGLAYDEERTSAFEAETSTARSLGIFGSPTFTVGKELFWGDDRLEDAIDWCQHGHLLKRH
ncbi:MAG: 2-hydroxychromene-2-carboxylate isomerase [Alphaproteobacteria bacterium]